MNGYRLGSLVLICMLLASVSGCIDKRSGSTAADTASDDKVTGQEVSVPASDAKPADKTVETPATPVDPSLVAAVTSSDSQPSAKAIPAKANDTSGGAETKKNAEPAKAATEGVSETRVRTPTRGNKNDNSGIAELTFDDIKFEMKEKEEPFRREMLTPAIEALNGKSVRLRGYILPSFQRELTQFVLMRDNMECCFGPGAWIYDCVIVEMKPGKTAEYTTRPVAVEGTFEVSEFLDADGKHLSVYRIQGEHAK
ncbi:MAG: DUF3299 domain-containing protein [Planctomycetaceae bacterium]|nr:DUF3299 domain-containing protein [Planctomycetaceae bacterium]